MAIVIDYQSLIDGSDNSSAIEEAFGPHPHCLGILIVKNLPTDYARKRTRLLRLSSVFAALPDEIKNKTVNEESKFSFGWSCGKEIMNGRPDFLKGSYYASPTNDLPVATDEQRKLFPSYCLPNIWPKDDLPDLEDAFKDLGKFIIDVGILVAKACDSFVSTKMPGATPNYLERIITESQTTKGRLLHYFPIKLSPNEVANLGEDSWCGWHVDHSSLTGLVSAMYFNESDPAFPETHCPDPDAGLYIKNRGGEVTKVSIPGDCLAFQLGQAMERASNGNLHATPHMVKGITRGTTNGLPIDVIARNTFAVFMQPSLEERVGDMTFAEFANGVLESHY